MAGLIYYVEYYYMFIKRVIAFCLEEKCLCARSHRQAVSRSFTELRNDGIRKKVAVPILYGHRCPQVKIYPTKFRLAL